MSKVSFQADGLDFQVIVTAPIFDNEPRAVGSISYVGGGAEPGEDSYYFNTYPDEVVSAAELIAIANKLMELNSVN